MQMQENRGSLHRQQWVPYRVRLCSTERTAIDHHRSDGKIFSPQNVFLQPGVTIQTGSKPWFDAVGSIFSFEKFCTEKTKPRFLPQILEEKQRSLPILTFSCLYLLREKGTGGSVTLVRTCLRIFIQGVTIRYHVI